MQFRTALTAAAVTVIAAGGAFAATASVDGLGGEVLMRSGSVDGVFSTMSPVFSSSDLEAIHEDLNDDGVATDGLVTSILLDTADGSLAWAVLVDSENPDEDFRGAPDSALEMSTTGNATHMEFINDSGSDIDTVIVPGSSKTAFGFFRWESATEGDAFAWDNLLTGDSFSFDFFEDTDITGPFGDRGGLPSNIDGFQFVSFNRNTEAWEVVAMGDFTQTQPGNPPQFSFSVNILVPTPQAALMGFAGIGGLGVIRRRKLS